MTQAVSEYVSVRGLRYHVRGWGAALEPDQATEPLLLLVHGWLDVSATFTPVAEALAAAGLRVRIPDWRGFGETEWPQDGYWFPDYVADLDALVNHYSPAQPVFLAGHSMGSTVAAHYAGLRPERVARLALLDGPFLPDGDPTTIVRRYRRWLDRLQAPTEVPEYASFEELAGRVLKRNPKLGPERAAFVARCWARQDADGLVRLQSDPKHLLEMPRTYLQAESDAIWSQVTADTLFIDGGDSIFPKSLPAAELARRRAQFRQHRQVSIAGAGHMLHFDAPEALAGYLAEHFRPQGPLT